MSPPETDSSTKMTSDDGHPLSRREFFTAVGVSGIPAVTMGQPTVADSADPAAISDMTHPATSAEDPVIEPSPRVTLERIAAGLTAPVGFETAPESADRRFIVDQTGTIHVHGPDGLESDPFLDISDRLVDLRDQFDERGLLGLAFHPDFSTNRKFYVRYSAPPRSGTPDDYDHTFVLSEFMATGDLSDGMLDSERVLLEIPEPQFNHNAGAIAFGPDGYLYVAVGDGGGANDVGTGHVADWYDPNAGGNGQDVTENLLGSILRIDVDASDGETPYGIPAENPLVGTDGLDEHYAWGFRNPWRMSFDGQGRLFVADAGQDLFEEVNIVEKGGNYGWNVREGFHCFSTESPSDPPSSCPDSTPTAVRDGESLIDPIIEYPHESDGQAVGTVVIGGHVYEAATIANLEEKYVFGDWSRQFRPPRGRLFAASPPSGDGTWTIEELRVEGAQDQELNRYVLGFGRDKEGELYVLASKAAGPTGTTGAVYKLTPPSPVETLDLGGGIAGWMGQAPAPIAEKTNPTFELVAGLKYEVKWENIDGVSHDFQILDDQDTVLVESSTVSQTGKTASVTFIATEEMTRYRCSFHPASMRGDIRMKSTLKTIGEAVAGADRTINLSEIQHAIDLWATDEPVPETGGQIIALPTMQRLVNAWAENKQIS